MTVATLVCSVLADTVVVIVVVGATNVQVWRGTGYSEVQNCWAGPKPLRMFATCKYMPALHGAVGHVATAKATQASPAIVSILVKICIS